MRKIYLKPPKELELGPDLLLELLKPLYGISDSGVYWHRTFTNHIKNDLGMDKTIGDLSLFTKNIYESFYGLSGVYIDDHLHAWNESFLKLTDKSLDKFESRKREMGNTLFAGVWLKTSFNEFRSLPHKPAWFTHTRPNIC